MLTRSGKLLANRRRRSRRYSPYAHRHSRYAGTAARTHRPRWWASSSTPFVTPRWTSAHAPSMVAMSPAASRRTTIGRARARAVRSSLGTAAASVSTSSGAGAWRAVARAARTAARTVRPGGGSSGAASPPTRSTLVTTPGFPIGSVLVNGRAWALGVARSDAQAADGPSFRSACGRFAAFRTAKSGEPRTHERHRHPPQRPNNFSAAPRAQGPPGAADGRHHAPPRRPAPTRREHGAVTGVAQAVHEGPLADAPVAHEERPEAAHRPEPGVLELAPRRPLVTHEVPARRRARRA